MSQGIHTLEMLEAIVLKQNDRINELEHHMVNIISFCHCWVMAEKTSDCVHTYDQILNEAFAAMGVKPEMECEQTPKE